MYSEHSTFLRQSCCGKVRKEVTIISILNYSENYLTLGLQSHIGQIAIISKCTVQAY